MLRHYWFLSIGLVSPQSAADLLLFGFRNMTNDRLIVPDTCRLRVIGILEADRHSKEEGRKRYKFISYFGIQNNRTGITLKRQHPLRLTKSVSQRIPPSPQHRGASNPFVSETEAIAIDSSRRTAHEIFERAQENARAELERNTRAL